MKKIVPLMMVVLFTVITHGWSQSKDEKVITRIITDFAQAGDQNDADGLEKFLDPNYRIVMNRLFGSTEVSVMPKAVYLDKIRNKEFGGDTRQLKFENIMINGNTAIAMVKFSGLKMSFASFITLVKDDSGNWKLVNEVPVII